jgi:MoxR-like ATPase
MASSLNWKEVETVLEAGVHAVLYGPPGTGKTRIATTKKSYSVTLTMETPAAELRGHFVPHGNEFIWHDGPALRAWREGARLVLNEIDQASGDALTFLHAILDDAEVARLTLPSGETVTPAAGFQAVATTNALDLSMVLPEALLDRFVVRIMIETPHPKALELLRNKGLANLVTSTVTNPQKSRVSLRQAMVFQRLRERDIAIDVAGRSVFGSANCDAGILASVLGVTR